MKNVLSSPFALFGLLFLLFNCSAFSQDTIVVTPPAGGVGACQNNLYRIIVNNAGGTIDTISITGTLSAVGSASCAASSQGVDFRVDTIGTVIHQGDTLRFTIGAGVIDTFFYHAYIDCHVIQDDTTTSTVNFIQHFTSTSAIIGLTANAFTSPNVSYPFIIELSSNANMNGYYLTESDFVFMYKNTNAGAAHMRFFFAPDTSNYCHQLTTDSILYQRGVNGALIVHNLASGDTITLYQNDTLLIHQQVTIIDCVSPCSRDTAIFKWKCNYPPSLNTIFCSSCQNDYLHIYNVTKDITPNLDVLRILPVSAIYDTSCMNDTAATTWSYKIINTGKEAIDTLRFNLLQNNNLINSVSAANLRFLSLLPISSIHMMRNGSTADISADTIARVYYLCTDQVPDALHRMNVTLTDFLTTDTLSISFKTFRCSSEDTALFNKQKNYNQWGFDSLQVINRCGVSKLITTTQGLIANTTKISGQSVGSGYDVDLKTTFLPTVTDLNFANGVGEKAQFYVAMN